MPNSLVNNKIAILIANGFDQNEMTAIQKTLQYNGAQAKLIAMNNGLVNSWDGSGWGHHFAADGVLNTSLAVDFSMLVIPGGRRSIEKLKSTAHTKRFLGGFLKAGKPVALFSEATELLVNAEEASGRTVSAPDVSHDALKAAGAEIAGQESCADKNLFTAIVDTDNIERVCDSVIDHFAGDAGQDLSEAA